MERALADTVIEGLPQTTAFLRQLVSDDAFKRGEVHTGFIGEYFERQEAVAAAAAHISHTTDRKDQAAS
jgi:acetyl/propionyl-CoA carboxylase alpha subunit